MVISKWNLPAIYSSQMETRSEPMTNGLPTSSFSSMLNNIIVGQDISAQEDAAQEASGTSCDCDETEKCMCDSEKAAIEAAEAKKTGIAACMECLMKDECCYWNGIKDELSIIWGIDRYTSTDARVSSPHGLLDFPVDLVSMAKTWVDYSNAYAYVSKKELGMLMSD